MTDLESIKRTLVGISKGENVLDTLMEFERTLDNAEVFAYQNWIVGELVDGPHIGRYFYRTVWMYPQSMMPDPDGGLRLTKLGANVSFKKGTFKKPVKVHGPQDWVDTQDKRAKMGQHPIWLVTIDMPIKYINRGLDQADAVIQQDIEKTNQLLADAYEDTETTTQDVAPEMVDDMGDDMDMGMDEDNV